MKIPSGRLAPLLGALLLTLGTTTATGCFGRYGFIAIGTAIDVLPDGYVTVAVGGAPYYYHRGMFYQRHRHGYVVVAAPIGAVVMMPPPGHVIVMVERDPYAYYRGYFYRQRGPGWVVVPGPPGAFVRRIPEGAVTRRVGNVEYKEYAGVYYRPAIRSGDRGWQVAEPPGRP
ncbi:MAG TPA: DUF6515 family protein [Longimicrobiales bacterium]|nr:DUF6515 family protein [Longimicrobiales bacterium]